MSRFRNYVTILNFELKNGIIDAATPPSPVKTHAFWIAVSQPPLTELLAKPVAISYSRPNDSLVLHPSCSAPGAVFSTGEMISSRTKVCVYLRGEPFSLVSWSGNNTRVTSHHLYSQPGCSLYCTLYCCRYSCYSFRFFSLSHSFSVRMLPHSRSPTHTLCTLRIALFLKGAHRQNLNPLLFHWSPRCGSI